MKITLIFENQSANTYIHTNIFILLSAAQENPCRDIYVGPRLRENPFHFSRLQIVSHENEVVVTVTTPPTSDSQITVSLTVRDCQSDGINGSGGCSPNKKFTDTLV